MSIFRGFQGGEIRPATEDLVAGMGQAAQMEAAGILRAGDALAQGIREYNKNASLNRQSLADSEADAGTLARMLSMIGQSPEYAPFVQQYSPLLEKAKKAPTMGMSQRLALANELKVATQNLGTDMQMYNIGVQSRARNIANQKAGELEGAEVPVGEQSVGIGIVLNPAKNTTSQLNAFRDKYNELNQRTGGKAGTWFGFLRKQQAQIEASVDAIPDNYFTQYDPNIDPKVARERMKADVRDYIANEEKTYIQSRDAFKDVTAENIRRALGQVGAFAFGGKDARQGAADYFSGLGRRVGEVSAIAQEADKRAMELSETVAPLDASVPEDKSPQRAAEVERRRVEAIRRTIPDLQKQQARLQSELGDLESRPVASAVIGYKGESVQVVDPELLTQAKAAYERAVQMYRNGDISYEEYARTQRVYNNYAYAVKNSRPPTDDEIVKLEQERQLGITKKKQELEKINTRLKEAEQGVLPKPKAPETPAQPRLVPSFGVANAVIGRETIKAQMGVAQKRQIVADFVKKQMGFDSATIDSVVSNMFPSDGPNVRTVQTAQGMATFVQNEKGGWNQVTGFASGEKSWGMFGTMTADGKLVPRTISSSNGKVQVRLAGQFQGPDSAFVKFNEGLATYMDGMEAAKRLKEIAEMGVEADIDFALKAEAEGLVARIKAAVRTEAVGTGSISNYEQGLLDAIILNPTNFFSLSSADKARILGVMDKMNSHLINKGRVWGVNVSTNLQSNSERETELRMLL